MALFLCLTAACRSPRQLGARCRAASNALAQRFELDDLSQSANKPLDDSVLRKKQEGYTKYGVQV